MMTIFTVVFGKSPKSPRWFPYPVFVFAGLIPWMLFSQGFAKAAVDLAFKST